MDRSRVSFGSSYNSLLCVGVWVCGCVQDCKRSGGAPQHRRIMKKIKKVLEKISYPSTVTRSHLEACQVGLTHACHQSMENDPSIIIKQAASLSMWRTSLESVTGIPCLQAARMPSLCPCNRAGRNVAPANAVGAWLTVKSEWQEPSCDPVCAGI